MVFHFKNVISEWYNVETCSVDVATLISCQLLDVFRKDLVLLFGHMLECAVLNAR